MSTDADLRTAEMEAERALGSDRARAVAERVHRQLADLHPAEAAELWRRETAREVRRG